jgi:hypothetical protein
MASTKQQQLSCTEHAVATEEDHDAKLRKTTRNQLPHPEKNNFIDDLYKRKQRQPKQ